MPFSFTICGHFVVDNTDYSTFTQATKVSIVNTSRSIAEMKLCMDDESALFGITSHDAYWGNFTI